MKIIPLITWMSNTENLIIKDVPVTSVVVETNDALIMVDTGMADNPWLEEDLCDMGYEPADFDLVINTHLHTDHIGGNRLFNKANIITSHTELEYQRLLERKLRACNDPLSVLVSLGRKITDNSKRIAQDLASLAAKYPVQNIIGDCARLKYLEEGVRLPEGIKIIKVPGHTIDSLAIILQGKNRHAVIAGDALYHRTLWKKDDLSDLHYSADSFKLNAAKLAKFDGIVIPGHDHPYDSRSAQYIITDVIEI